MLSRPPAEQPLSPEHGNTPPTADGLLLLQQALALHRAGQLNEAEAVYQQLLELDPQHFDALQLLGAVYLTKRDPDGALAWLNKALAVRPTAVAAMANKGVALRQLGRLEEAAKCLAKATQLRPDHVEASNSLGNVLADLQRHEGALRAYDAVLRLQPTHHQAARQAAKMCLLLKRPEESVQRLNVASGLGDSSAELLVCLGDAYRAQGQLMAAQTVYAQALARDLNSAPALVGKARAEVDVGQYAEALKTLHPTRPPHEDDSHAERAWLRGLAHLGLKQFQPAVRAFVESRQLGCPEPRLDAYLLHARMKICDWAGLDQTIGEVTRRFLDGQVQVEPFALLAITDEPELHLQAATSLVQALYPLNPLPTQTPAAKIEPVPKNGRRLKVAYLSGEFRHHATAVLLVEMLEAHDQSAFEVIALDNGWDDHSELRRRLSAAIPDFRAVANLSDQALAQMVKDSGVDILVNLNGFFGRMRQGVFAQRPAALQVNFLGYPGSLGAEYIDYIIGDRVVIPASYRNFYTEKWSGCPAATSPTTASGVRQASPIQGPAMGCLKKALSFAASTTTTRSRPSSSASGCICSLKLRRVCCGCCGTTLLQPPTSKKRPPEGASMPAG